MCAFCAAKMLKYTIRLDTRESEKTKKGFPVVAYLSLNGTRKRISLKLYFFLSDWDLKKQLPKKDKRAAIFIKKKQLLLDEIGFDIFENKNLTLDDIKLKLFGSPITLPNKNFYDFFDIIIEEKRSSGKIATADIYSIAKKNLMIYKSHLLFLEIDYNFLNSFKNWKLSVGNKKNTVHSYLRKIRFVYNEAVRRGLVEDKNPFLGVFRGVTVKANRTKKKYLSIETIEKMESINGLADSHQRAVDLWLLMFYLGGQSLRDLYFLKSKNVHKGRVFFKRAKLDDLGYEFDLKILPKAKKIINKYTCSGEYLFGSWRKDEQGYKNFRGNFRRSLQKVQRDYSLEVLPKGGNMTVSTARHTFATRGKFLFVEPDLLRELMGHERSEVDTIYKDRFPQKVRDQAHLKIVTT